MVHFLGSFTTVRYTMFEEAGKREFSEFLTNSRTAAAGGSFRGGLRIVQSSFADEVCERFSLLPPPAVEWPSSSSCEKLSGRMRMVVCGRGKESPRERLDLVCYRAFLGGRRGDP